MAANQQSAIDEINRLYRQLVGRSQARFRYCIAQIADPSGKEVKDKRYAFGWSTERVGEEQKFYAFIYRIMNKGRHWKIIRKVGFGKRRVAKARAHKWRDQHKEKMLQKLQEQTCRETKVLAIIAN